MPGPIGGLAVFVDEAVSAWCRRGMRWSVVFVAVAAFVAGWVRVASACSCGTGVLPGAGRFYPKAGRMLPLDAPGIPRNADWNSKPRH
jgi:hypothetical protein